LADHPSRTWTRDAFLVSTEPSLVDVDVVHRWLTESSYWVPGIPRAIVAHGIEHSLNFGLYVGEDRRQIGLARVITDYATFAYVCDVFVLDEHRGGGLGVWLMECVAAHPELQGLRRWMLGTKDAHGLYEKTGFAPVAAPDRWMERVQTYQ
jgi:GNAT superfamily N-acetyltransferase